MCHVMEVSRSGFYRWVEAQDSERRREDRELLERIREIHEESRGTYGSPRIYRELKKEGWQCGRNRVARLMREAGIRAKCARKFKPPKTTDSNHKERIFPNRLPEVTIDGPDQVWAADITYIPTEEGWVYLATVIDLFSRRVVGWALAATLKTELPLAALRMALARRAAPKLHHSDRGSQYASKDYRRLLKAHGIEGSMSRKGNCYDNATQESFYHTLKTELVFHEHYRNIVEARSSLFDYIEIFYNRKRSHSSLGYKSPAEFEGELAA